FSGLMPVIVNGLISVWGTNICVYLVDIVYNKMRKVDGWENLRPYEKQQFAEHLELCALLRYNVCNFLVPSLVAYAQYPFKLCSNLMAVAGSGLLASLLPYSPTFNDWFDTYNYLAQNCELYRGDWPCLRREKGSIQVGPDNKLYGNVYTRDQTNDWPGILITDNRDSRLFDEALVWDSKVMPTIPVKKRLLDKHLGTCLTQEEVDELCFQYGLELDDVLIEKNETTGVDEEIYKIEIPANRYDLLCVEGLTRALLIFQNKLIKVPSYKLSEAKPLTIIVEKETANVRKYVVGAVLRDIKLDADIYSSFIDLQDKLHQNIGRKRTLASIGTHDLDTIKGPFKYCARKPEEIIFKPLNQNKEDKPLYPVIYDSQGIVCSLPPIINSDHSKITLNTKNIFIEATGTDLKKLEIVLDTVVTIFSQYCKEPFLVEPVEIIDGKGSCVYPKFKAWKGKVDVKNMSRKIGIAPINVDKAMQFLAKMSLTCSNVEKNETQIEVKAPPTRHDILHECDLVEDLALAFGYNNIPPLLPQSNTVAEPFNLNKLSDQLRLQMAMSGWTEIMNFALCSTEDVGNKLRRPDFELKSVVKIANPKTLEFQVVRNSLLPGILKTISNNKDMPLPLKLFEVQDVVFIDNNKDTKCRNERHLAAVFYSKTGAFEIIHGLLDRIMQMLNVNYIENTKDFNGEIKGYKIQQKDDPTFFDGRCAEIIYKNHSIGTFGVLHPEVINSFSLVNPCSAMEINIEEFL
uniref:Phenylalanine--tRNA ligase beta subunit n=1 Tax=Meloidogyne javanica TaxID=6303 RepID=A0A915M1Z9_MELJA